MRYVAAVLVLVSFLVSCGSDRSTNSTPVLNYPDESTNAALFYGGQLRAPVPLAGLVDRELYILRHEWRDSFQVTDITFRLLWRKGLVNVWIDSAYVDSFKSETWEPWATLKKNYGLTYYQGFPIGSGWAGTFHTGEPLHSGLLAAKCAGLPGLIYASRDPSYAPYGSIWTRMEYDGEAHYFFDRETDMEGAYRTDYFVVARHKASYIGTHWEFPPDADSVEHILGPYEYYHWLERWIDSSRTQHPAWVDTAYMAREYWRVN